MKSSAENCEINLVNIRDEKTMIYKGCTTNQISKYSYTQNNWNDLVTSDGPMEVLNEVS